MTLFPDTLSPVTIAPIVIPASPPVIITVLFVAETPDTPPKVLVDVPPFISTVLLMEPKVPSELPTVFPPIRLSVVPPLKMTLLSFTPVRPIPPVTLVSLPVPVVSIVTVLPEAEFLVDSPPIIEPVTFPDNRVTVLLSAGFDNSASLPEEYPP